VYPALATEEATNAVMKSAILRNRSELPYLYLNPRDASRAMDS
jgi:hypothetical protein